MKSKKIALVASILMVTLAVGVYAGVQLSNKVTTGWTLKESGNNLNLYWAYPEGGYGRPTGDRDRGKWINASIGLENVGDAPYNVTGKFKIWVGSGTLPPGCITIEYNERGYDPGASHFEAGWTDMTGVLQYSGGTATGWFGPAEGFTVTVPYDVVAHYRILFVGDATIDMGYGFEAWIEEAPA